SQLKAQPDSLRALENYGALRINMGQFAEALPYLERALQISPKDEPALLNHALACLSLDRLDAAQQDYETLLSSGTSTYLTQVHFGLAEIFFKKKNRKESLKQYKLFVKVAPAGVPQRFRAKERIKLLESGSAL